MVRRVGIIGLAAPLLAVVGAIIYLNFFGTDEPTFTAAAREFAADNTVVQLSTEPPAALIVPEEPPESAQLFIMLADDDQHIWNAARATGLLPLVEAEQIALLIAPGVTDVPTLDALAKEAEAYFEVEIPILTAFDGEPLRTVCPGWGVAVVIGTDSLENRRALLESGCAANVVEPGDELGERIIEVAKTWRSDLEEAE